MIFQTLVSLKLLQRFMAMAYHFHRFLPKIVDILFPLYELIIQQEFKEYTESAMVGWMPNSLWCGKTNYCFTSLILTHPVPDAPYTIITNALAVAVGAFGFFFLKYYANRTFDRELLAIYLSIKYFRHYLEGREFTVYTDHKSIKGNLFQKRTNHTDSFAIWN